MKLNNFKKLSFFVIILINLNLVLNAFGFGVETHKTINSYIADESSSIYGSYLHNYLQKNLGLHDGIKTIFDSKMAKIWISDGGASEDNHPRPLAHFHNPLTNEGLWGNISAREWALLPIYTQRTTPFVHLPLQQILFSGADYSWHDSRYYYYRALWSDNKADSEKYFAETFRGLGQVMHISRINKEA